MPLIPALRGRQIPLSWALDLDYRVPDSRGYYIEKPYLAGEKERKENIMGTYYQLIGKTISKTCFFLFIIKYIYDGIKQASTLL